MADTTNTSTLRTTTGASSMGAPSAPAPAVPGRRYRARGESAREHRLTPRFTDEELAAIRAAAEAAQMTLTGFCALAALAAARRQPGQARPAGGSAGVSADELAEMQRDLFAARTAVNRTGVNLNQAVAQLNSTGQPPVWLEYAVNRVARAVAELDGVVSGIDRRLRDRRP